MTHVHIFVHFGATDLSCVVLSALLFRLFELIGILQELLNHFLLVIFVFLIFHFLHFFGLDCVLLCVLQGAYGGYAQERAPDGRSDYLCFI